MKAELGSAKVRSALSAALAEAKAIDAEYVEYKLRTSVSARGEEIEVDESGKIKHWEELLAELKRSVPQQFAHSERRRAVPTPLPKHDAAAPMSRSEFLKKPYAERAAMMAEAPEAYKCIMEN